MTITRACATLAIGAAVALIGAGCSSDDDAEPGAPTIVVNADVYTVDEARSRAEAFAYDASGELIAVGDEAEVRAAAGPGAREIDAGGAFVLPGFQDPHVHVPEAGLNSALCLFSPEESIEDYEVRAAECAAEQPGTGWVRGAGAAVASLRDSTELPIDVLDRAIPDRPALIIDDLGHAVWANSAALAAAGIEPDEPDPQGGILERDPDTGRLTGLVLENAQHRLRDAAAEDPDTIYSGLLVALEELAANGITSTSDAGGYWTRGHSEAWIRAAEEGALTVRANNALYVFPDRPMDEQLEELTRRFDDDGSDRLRFATAKVYVDGILDLQTAAVTDGYRDPIDPDRPGGFEYFRPDQLQTYAQELHDRGFQLNVHVIGDAATRRALDAVAGITASDVPERRHRVTHTYLVDPADLGRFAQIGVVADLQMAPDAIDPAYQRTVDELLASPPGTLVPTASLLDAGADVTLSSDWDADPLSPLGTIERALTRPTEAVPDLETAIELVTLAGARVMRHDDTTGSIEVGKQADYVVLDRSPFEVPPDEIGDIEVVETVLGGERVFPG